MTDRASIVAEDGAALKIRELLLEAVRQTPNGLAVVDGDMRLTFSELSQKVDAYARGLLALGVSRGDRVAMLTPPAADFWIVLHAASSIGAIWVGVNPRYQERDFQHLLGDCEPRVLVAVSPFEARDYCTALAPVPMHATRSPAVDLL